MADSSVAITAGTGTAIDTRTQANGDHRQVTVLGDETNTTTARVSGLGLAVVPANASTATRTTPAVTTAPATLLAANTARISALVYNETGNTLYLAYGTGATLSSYTVLVPVGTVYEIYNYSGALTGLTATGTATVRVTELT